MNCLCYGLCVHLRAASSQRSTASPRSATWSSSSRKRELNSCRPPLAGWWPEDRINPSAKSGKAENPERSFARRVEPFQIRGGSLAKGRSVAQYKICKQIPCSPHLAGGKVVAAGGAEVLNGLLVENTLVVPHLHRVTADVFQFDML